MCGRTFIGERKALAKKAGVELGTGTVENDSNRPPGTDMPVILDARPGKLHDVKWGLIPNGAAEKPKFTTTYARIERMQVAPIYRDLVGRRHCVFVIDGFYEFDKRETPSQPYFFKRVDGDVLLLAGLWDTWKDPGTGIVLVSATMIMQPANQFLSRIHDRMPCVLSQKQASTWLDVSLSKEQRLTALQPVPERLLEGWQVDKKLNNARNKDQNNNTQTGPQMGLFED
ncbi:SOS response-associated peptidase [Pedobacter sp. SYP-B3415]|uniref:SOS response-associated peptidase n=1 Tax=Pedobacter sp. SYP-B3415 TaxID=2496641 RepID=UPI00101CCCC4|nr:SOS response-associated peptidase [Pedobacter sp. SYP-B3415]